MSIEEGKHMPEEGQTDQPGNSADGVRDARAERIREAISELGPGGSQREKQGFFRKAAGMVGRTIGDAAGGIGGAVGEAAGGIGRRGEALLGGMGNALENRKAFGRSVADFALKGGATGALRFGTRELAKSVVVWSGLAGAVGGGLTGTIVAGAFVGAVGGAAVEYARQVAKNVKEVETDPALAGRKSAFLRKLKPNDYRRIGKAAIFGAVAGAGAGALVEYVPEISEFAREHLGGLRSVFGGAKEAVGNLDVGRTIGDAAGVAGRTGEDLLGGAKDLAGQLPDVEGAGTALSEATGTVSKTVGDVVGGAAHLPGVEGVQGIVGGAKDIAGNIPGVEGVKDLAGQLPGVQGAGETLGTAGRTIGDVRGGIGEGIGDTAGNIGRTVGLGGAQQAGEEVAQGAGQAAPEAAQGAGQAAGEAIKAPEGFVPQADVDALKEQLAAQGQDLSGAHQTIEDLQRQLAEAKQALAAAKEVAPTGEVAGAAAAATGAAAAQAAAEQAAAHAQSALESFGGSIPLPTGSNPWEVSESILSQMGVTHPTPEQIMQLDKVLSQENGISVPEWGIKGVIDDRNLPVGFKLNLTDVVKKAALGIASKK